MRLKAVEDVAGMFAGKSPLLIAGAAALAMGAGYYVYKTVNKGDVATTEASPSGYLTSPSSQAPISLAGIGPSGASGADTIGSIIGGSSSSDTGAGSPAPAPTTSTTIFQTANPTPVSTGVTGDLGAFPSVAGIDPATAELLAQERVKQQNFYDISMATLAANAQVNAQNAYLQSQSILSMNYVAATSLAQTFMLSNNQMYNGVIMGPDGKPLVEASMMQNRNSDKNGWNNTEKQFLDQGGVTQFWNQVPGVSQIGNITPTPTSGVKSIPGATVDYFQPFSGTAPTAPTAPAPQPSVPQTIMVGHAVIPVKQSQPAPQPVQTVAQQTKPATSPTVTPAVQAVAPSTPTFNVADIASYIHLDLSSIPHFYA